MAKSSSFGSRGKEQILSKELKQVFCQTKVLQDLLEVDVMSFEICEVLQR